jgi:RNA polymerase sigma factor (TIGR02999 family)
MRTDIPKNQEPMERGALPFAEELLSLVYEELRRLAAAKMAQEKPGQTLQATALVHEAWLRLVGPRQGEGETRWNDRHHFFCAAAEAIRRILVENARRKQRTKHGGHLQRVEVERVNLECPLPDEQLLAVNEALDRLGAVNPRAAEVVKLKFFIGLTEPQVAQHLGLSVPTVQRTWAFARAWLFLELKQELGAPFGLM